MILSPSSSESQPDMQHDLPHVSVIIPVLNEQHHLVSALESLIDCGGYPKSKLEVLIIDGGSRDGTTELLDQIIESRPYVRKVVNNQQTTPHALNLGIKNARHEIILRADAHAIYQQNYILNSVKALLDGKGDNVGGRIVSIPNRSDFSVVLAGVLNSPLGSGNPQYRRSCKGREVDTVWCGCWYKNLLIEVGGFDPLWVNNQDAELNARLKARGYRVYLARNVSAELVTRNDIVGLIRQYFRYGRGRAKTMLRHPDSLRARQLLPVALVALMLALLTYAPLVGVLVALGGLLLIPLLLAGITSMPVTPQLLLWSGVAVFGIHISWVAGLLAGFIEICLSRELRAKVLSNTS